MSKISLYIPVYNGALYIRQTLESVFLQTLMPNEVIVVDDGSTDDTIKLALDFDVKVIRHGERRGLAAARNTGVSASQFEYVASLDVDCVPSRTWLCACFESLVNSGAAGVGGQVRDVCTNGSADLWRSLYLPQNSFSRSQKVPALAGANTLFKKQDILSVGGYDDRFFTNHEDTSLSLKLQKSGRFLFYEAKAQVMHIKRDTCFSVLSTCWRYRHASRINSLLSFLAWCGRDFLRSIKMFFSDLFKLRFKLLYLDVLYWFVQVFFSSRSFLSKEMK